MSTKAFGRERRNAPGPRGREALRWAGRIRREGILAAIVALQDRYGDRAEIKIPFGPRLCFAFGPDDAVAILQKDAKKFVKGSAARPFKLLIGEGLSVAEGDVWRAQRRLVQPAFHMKSLEAYGPTMAEAARTHRKQWLSSEDARRSLDLNAAFSRLTHDIVARALLGADLGPKLDLLQRAWQASLTFVVARANSLIKLPLWLPLPSHRRFHRAIGEVNATVDRIVAREAGRTQSEASNPTLLARLLQARREGSANLSNRDIRDQVLNFLFAGHETTANAMAWTIHLLSESADSKRKLLTELDRELAGQPPSWDKLDRLPYLRCVVYESLRLRPPVAMFVRQALEDVPLASGDIPKGAVVVLSPFAMHRRPDLWARAEEFWPERFEDPSVKPAPPAFLAFGAGARVCVGDSFAVKEMMIVLADLLQAVDFEPIEGQATGLFFNGTLRPAPLFARLRPRFSAAIAARTAVAGATVDPKADREPDFVRKSRPGEA